MKNRTTRKTYAVYGLTEWQALIPAGRAIVRVNFTGGMMSSLGVVPATFSTNNESVQRLIENSDYYKQKRIVNYNRGRRYED